MKLAVIGAALALGLTGCSLLSPVPVTKVSGTIAGQKFSFVSPKDSVTTNLMVSVGTNGTATLSIGYISATQDVPAIASSYAGIAAVVTATGEAVLKAVTAGASKAVVP